MSEAVTDPGASTFEEELAGLRKNLAVARERLQVALDLLKAAPPSDTSAAVAYSNALGEWKHWREYVRRWEAKVARHEREPGEDDD